MADKDFVGEAELFEKIKMEGRDNMTLLFCIMLYNLKV